MELWARVCMFMFLLALGKPCFAQAVLEADMERTAVEWLGEALRGDLKNTVTLFGSSYVEAFDYALEKKKMSRRHVAEIVRPKLAEYAEKELIELRRQTGGNPQPRALARLVGTYCSRWFAAGCIRLRPVEIGLTTDELLAAILAREEEDQYLEKELAKELQTVKLYETARNGTTSAANRADALQKEALFHYLKERKLVAERQSITAELWLLYIDLTRRW